ncbi:MarR family winged helix-turn-helix transcriptional regulator [Streptomyces lincolnensis]|uniref:MarR family winged helix-turn-helix transcriptional regulator n=1 Tax=Streptomyces lincolnensis TaxID=1915 RepID=UPI0037D48DE1
MSLRAPRRRGCWGTAVLRRRGATPLRRGGGTGVCPPTPPGSGPFEPRSAAAASQLVDEIVRKGYAERRPHPEDARARLVVLTERGWACTRAAEEAAAEAVGAWVALLGEGEVRALRNQLGRIAPYGPIKPAW